MTRSLTLLPATFTLFACAALAQDRPSYGPAISIDQAKKVAAAAVAESKKNNWRMAISIVDNHGFPVYFERMDDTQTAGGEVAMDKARSAAMFRRSTKVFEDGVMKGRVTLLALTGASPLEGGLPLMVDGKVLGGIGVSGGSAEEDGRTAQAGANALK
jgi:uncharacterized protein GlcG (DUF336 family)